MLNNIIYFFLLTGFFCCQKKEAEPVLYMPHTAITGTFSLNESSGFVRGTLSEVPASKAEEYGVVWGQTPEPDISGSKKSFTYSKGVSTFSSQLDNLMLGQTYYVRSYVRSSSEIIYSETVSFIHQGPFVWKLLSSVSWSDRQHEAYGTVVNGAIYVIRPISQSDTEVWLYIPRRDTWLKQPNLAIFSTRYEPIYFTMNKAGNESVFIAGGYRINEDVPGSQVFLREHFGFNMPGNVKGFDYYDFPFGNSLLAHFVLEDLPVEDRAYVLSMDKSRAFAEFQWGVLWNEKKPFPGEFLGRYVAFAIGKKGYVLVESNGRSARTKDLYEYEPQRDSWIKKADFPGKDRINGIAFSVDGKGYYGAGEAKDAIEGLKDLWQYNPEEDKWEKFADFPGSANVKVIANTIGDKVYMGLGFRIENSSVGAKQYTRAYDYWEFSPKGNSQ